MHADDVDGHAAGVREHQGEHQGGER